MCELVSVLALFGGGGVSAGSSGGMNGTTCCFVGVSWEPQAIESAAWVSCDDGVMAAFSSAGCPVTTGTGCAAARLVIEFDMWTSGNCGIASGANAAWLPACTNPICAATLANCLAAISMPLGVCVLVLQASSAAI